MLIDPQTGKEATDLERVGCSEPNQHGSSISGISPRTIRQQLVITAVITLKMALTRLNTITFGYTLPTQLVQKAKISNVRLYCTLNNIHTFTSYTDMTLRFLLREVPLLRVLMTHLSPFQELGGRCKPDILMTNDNY